MRSLLSRGTRSAVNWRVLAIVALAALIAVVRVAVVSPGDPALAAAGQTAEVFYKRSTDGGATFGGFQNISADASRTDEFPDVGIAGSNVYVAWEAPPSTGAEQDIYVKRSTNGGLAFSDLRNVSNNPTRSTEPDIAAGGSNAYLVWKNPSDPNDQGSETDIFHSRSTDAGLAWGAAANLSNNLDATAKPVVAASGSNVIAAYHNGATPDIYTARSTNSGGTFASPFNLSNDADRSKIPAIVFEAANVHVVWENPLDGLGTGIPDILYRRSADSGATWTPNPATTAPTNLSNTPGVTSKAAAVAVSGSTVHVVWVETIGNDEIVYTRSTDGGANWSAPVNISATSAKSAKPAIAANGSGVYVAWEDDGSGGGDIYYRYSTDGGLNWLPNPAGAPQNLSNNPGRSSEPSIAVDAASGVVHIVWFDFSLSPAAQIPTAVTLGSDIYEFGLGTTAEVWFRRLSGGIWTDWISLGGVVSAPPAAVAAGSDLYVFAPGSGNDLWYRKLSGGVWGAWTPLGGIVSGVPSAVATSANNVYVFVRGSGQDVWYRHFNGTVWEAWAPLGGIMTAGPTTAAAGTDIFVFGRGQGNDLWYRRFSSGVWGAWTPLGGVITSAPSAAATAANNLYVFVRGDGGDAWYRRWNGSTFEAWAPLGGVLKAGPTAAAAGSDIYMFAIGDGDDLWSRRLSGGVWGAWTPLGGLINAAPSGTATGANDVYIFVRGNAFDDVWYRHFNGTAWEGWVPLGGTLTAGPS